MGWAAARKLRRAVSPTCGASWPSSWCAPARAIDLRAPLAPAAGTGAALAVLRGVVAGPGPDRWLSPDLLAAERVLAEGSLLAAVGATVGPLEAL